MAGMTPLGAVVRGALAGAVGTAAMDAFWYARHRMTGGAQDPLTFEFGGPSDWDSVSAPAQVGRRIVEGLTLRPLDARWARLTNTVMHWGYGIAWSTVLGVVGGSVPRMRPAEGPLFGLAVWGSGYVILPALGLYKPVWEYGFRELAPEIGAHLVYGTTTAGAFAVLRRVGR